MKYIGVYIFAKVLLQLRKQFGLEAMLEFIEGYARGIETSCPQVKNIVENVFKHTNFNHLIKGERNDSEDSRAWNQLQKDLGFLDETGA